MQKYPMQKQALSTEYLREHCHLRARTDGVSSMLRLRDQVCRTLHEYFKVCILSIYLSTAANQSTGIMYTIRGWVDMEERRFFAGTYADIDVERLRRSGGDVPDSQREWASAEAGARARAGARVFWATGVPDGIVAAAPGGSCDGDLAGVHPVAVFPSRAIADEPTLGRVLDVGGRVGVCGERGGSVRGGGRSGERGGERAKGDGIAGGMGADDEGGTSGRVATDELHEGDRGVEGRAGDDGTV